MSVLVAVVGLGLLILVHEAGHFFVARAVGMSPRKFYVGFPPALVKTTRKGIEYGLGSIPLGGYVKIPGMHRPAPGDADVWFHRAREEAPGLSGPVDRVRRALERGDYDGARAAAAELEEGLDAESVSPAAERAARKGLDEIRDGTGRDAYWRARTWKRVAVIFAGPGANLLLAVVLFTGLYMAGGGKATTVVGEVIAGSPAAAAGLRPGDRILSIDGRRVQEGDIAERISQSKGRPLTLTLERAGDGVETLRGVRAEPLEGRYRLGFVLRGRGLGPAEASWQAVELTANVTQEIGASLARLVTGEGRKDIASPVGIVQGSSQAAKQGIDTYLWVLGLISLSLALLNLLPLLPLDGGHIAFSLIEGVRGRAVAREVYERVSAIGLALVLILFFIGLQNDIGRLGGG